MSKQLPANISLTQLGKAMSELDLSGVPPEKRHIAIMDHLMRIQEDTLQDRTAAAKIGAIRRHVHNQSAKSAGTIVLPPGFRTKQ